MCGTESVEKNSIRHSGNILGHHIRIHLNMFGGEGECLAKHSISPPEELKNMFGDKSNCNRNNSLVYFHILSFYVSE